MVRFFKKYSIIQLLIFTLAALAAYKPLSELFFKVAGIEKRDTIYDLFALVIPIIYAAFMFLVIFTTLRNDRYRVLTGRSFVADHGKYLRDYYSLVDYFRDSEPHKLDLSGCKKGYWRKQHGLVVGAVEDPKEIKKLRKQNSAVNSKKKSSKKKKSSDKPTQKKLALITLPSTTETNIAVFGPPGSYKTSGIAIINAITFQGSVLAVDIKGDLYNYCNKYRNIVRFCPDDPDALHSSVKFNPLQGINQMSVTDKKLYLESMATILVPDEGGEDGAYFTTRARKFFQGIAHMLLFENKNASFPDIIHAILRGNPFDWVKKAMQGQCTEAAELLSSFFGNNEKNVSGVYDALTTALISYSNPTLDVLLGNTGDCISIETLEQGTDVYLQVSQQHLDTYAPLFTLLLQSFSTAFTNRPDSSSGVKNRPILMLLDEFPQLTFSYKMINSNLSTLRSKSIICMLIQQNFSQLERKYEETGARSLIGNCNLQLILGSNDTKSSKMFSELCGTKKVLKISNSETQSQNESVGRSVNEAREPVFYPEDFSDLPATNSMVLYYKGKYHRVRKLNCYQD